jgi:hypothetical protein
VPPLVAIRSVVASWRAYSVYADPVLPPHSTSLRVGYSVLSLSIPERVRSRHRLVGSDVEWQDGCARAEVPYNNLGPGKYTFQVSAEITMALGMRLAFCRPSTRPHGSTSSTLRPVEC